MPGAPGPAFGTWDTTKPVRANSERLPHRRWLVVVVQAFEAEEHRAGTQLLFDAE